MNIYWLLGFIEGEGSFGVTVGTKMYKGKKHSWPRAQFQIIQVEKKPFLAIKEFLKAHNIKASIYGPYKIPVPINRNSKTPYQEKYSECFFLRINRIEDNVKLIELLDPLEWQTSKRLNYEKWKDCVLEKAK